MKSTEKTGSIFGPFATVETFNPGSAHRVINGVVQLVIKELEMLTVLPKSSK